MFISNVHNISFGAMPIKQPVCINKDLSDTADSIISAAYKVKDIVEHMSPSKRTPFIQRFGVTKVYADMSNGIIFSANDNDYVLSSNGVRTLHLQVKSKSNGHVIDSFYIKDRKLAKTDTKKGIPTKIDFYTDKTESSAREKQLKEILDELDFRLLKMRLAKTGNEVPKSNLAPASTPKGFLSQTSRELASDIINEFFAVNENMQKVKSRATRVKIKAAYPKIQKGVSGTKNMTFLGIGDNQEDISVNALRVRGKIFLVLKISQKDLPDKNIIICPDGTVQKQPAMAFVRDANIVGKDNITAYFSQTELNSSCINNYLSVLKRELKAYCEHVRIRVNKLESKKEFKTTQDIGTIDKYSNLLESVQDNYDYFKGNIVKYSPSAQKRQDLRNRHSIITQVGQPALIFKRITDDRNDIYLSFPITQGRKVMKLLEMKDGKVLNTFLVDDGKLVKFDVKSMNNHKINNIREIHYHSQEYIDKSPLEDYLHKINRVLNSANSEIKDVIKSRNNQN